MRRPEFLAKIAVSEAANPPRVRVLGRGDGWTVSDVVCSAGPHDKPFEERHVRSSIAIVVSGTFQYRYLAGCELMTPGSVLLGNANDCFSCGHEHGAGDRCVSFSYEPEFLERIVHDAGARGRRFRAGRLPPIRALSPVVATATAILSGTCSMTSEELSVFVAGAVAQLERGAAPQRSAAEPSSLARVSRVVRMIENQPDAAGDLSALARIARLSPFHFLRMFQGLTGTTPHQYLLRTRLRSAAVRLRAEPARILDIALDCGFQDASHFVRAFRAEFGVSPRAWRRNVG